MFRPIWLNYEKSKIFSEFWGKNVYILFKV